MKKLFLIAGILAISTVTVAKATVKRGSNVKNGTTVSRKSENNGGTAAANFINEFVKLDSNANVENWLKTQNVTDNFRKQYNNQIKAMDLSNAVLDGKKKLTAQEEKFIQDYDVDYGPVFGAAWEYLSEGVIIDGKVINTPVNFEVKSFNEKTGDVVLRDNARNIDFPVKVVKVNGKWLVDGAGTVNISK